MLDAYGLRDWKGTKLEKRDSECPALSACSLLLELCVVRHIGFMGPILGVDFSMLHDELGAL
jgi:hypothetical protein